MFLQSLLYSKVTQSHPVSSLCCTVGTHCPRISLEGFREDEISYHIQQEGVNYVYRPEMEGPNREVYINAEDTTSQCS